MAEGSSKSCPFGGSVALDDLEVVEVSAQVAAGWSSRRQKRKRTQVVPHEIIELDADDDPDGVMIIGEKTSDNKNKQAVGYPTDWPKNAKSGLAEDVAGPSAMPAQTVYPWNGLGAYHGDLLGADMATQKAERTALGEITNNNTAHVDEAERKREERNRKQREYRARRKAEEFADQREERNKRRREQRLLKRTESSTHIVGADYARHGVCSSILQASNAQDKENVFSDDNMDWLHRNHNYVWTRQPTYDNSCVPDKLSGHTLMDASAATPGSTLVKMVPSSPIVSMSMV